MGMELKAKQVMGTSRKKKAKVNKLSVKFKKNGAKAKINELVRMTVLYPKYVENLVAMSTKKQVGSTTHSKRKELVLDVTSTPLFLR